MTRLLIIEDNLDLVANLYAFFEPLGYVLDHAVNGMVGLELASSNEYDAIILDLSLPRMDGLTVCEKLRNEFHVATPVLMLTARDPVKDRVQGFAVGADDYLIKPFSLLELDSRIKALIRRAQGRQVSGVLKWGDLQVNTQLPKAQRGTAAIKLAPKEHKLLLRLMRTAPEVVSKRQLEFELWGEEPPESGALRTHLHDLRNRIDKGHAVALIETVHGVGVRLRALADQKEI